MYECILYSQYSLSYMQAHIHMYVCTYVDADIRIQANIIVEPLLANCSHITWDKIIIKYDNKNNILWK